MNTNDWVICTEGLSRSFGAVHALKSLDLRVPQKSIFAFLGPNGAGKTTTIKLLLGLIRPTSGSGQIFGMDILHDSVDIRANIGYLPQETRFYEHMTARQTLEYTAKFFYVGPQSAIDKRVNEMIELVGLEGKADRPIKGFSGGERQRLGIAQAEVNYPDLLILDEPAASLDPMGRHDVLAVMEKLRKYTTVFYSTHILEDVQRVSDAVAILDRGKLIAEAPIGELLAGKGGSAVYSLTMRGTPISLSAAQERITSQPWVQSMNAAVFNDQVEDGMITWQVSVTDDDAADDLLLRMVL